MLISKSTKRQLKAMLSENKRLSHNQTPTRIRSIVNQGTAQSNTPMAISTVVRWFNLTDVSASPMTGDMQRWKSEADEPDWGNHNIEDADIYPHPESTYAQYQTGLCACVYVGNRWFAIERPNASVRWAFCSAAAGTGSTLSCYLDEDTNGESVTVNFTLLGGISNLSDGHLTLADGTPIPVMMRDGDWWCIIPIEGTEDCE
jgi:hypothetical protein